MNEQVLQRRIARHNALQLTLGVGLAAAALCLWPASFYVWRFLIAFPLLSVYPQSAVTISWYGAWFCTLLLAAEGFRYAKPLFDLADYSRSFYYDNDFTSGDSVAAMTMRYRTGNPQTYA